MSKVEVDHIGIIVDDLDAAIARYEAIFGAPDKRVELEEVGLKVAEFHTVNVTIELIQYAGENDALPRRVMGEVPGLNHISLKVDDLTASLETARGAGLTIQTGFPRRGAHGVVAFFERDPATGLLIEFCQPDARTDHAPGSVA